MDDAAQTPALLPDVTDTWGYSRGPVEKTGQVSARLDVRLQRTTMQMQPACMTICEENA